MQRQHTAAANEMRIAAMHTEASFPLRKDPNEDEILLSDVEEDIAAEQIQAAADSAEGETSAQVEPARLDTFDPTIPLETRLSNVKDRAQRNRDTLRDMSSSKKKSEKALAKDFYEGCYELAKQQQKDYRARIRAETEEKDKSVASTSTTAPQSTRNASATTKKKPFFLSGDCNDYVLVDLEADGLTPSDPDQIYYELTQGKVFGLRGQVKYEAGKKMPDYNDEGEAWRYDVFDKLQQVSAQDEPFRRENLKWLHDLVGEGLDVLWRKERKAPPLGHHYRYHSWVLEDEA